MHVEDFDFDLPEELIAQTPLNKRDNSKLLLLNKTNGQIKHRSFFNIIDYFEKGDVLVLNDTKVMPARLIGVKEETGAVIELLLLNECDDYEFEALAKPAKRIKIGTKISFGDKLYAECIEKRDEGIIIVKFTFAGIFLEVLEELGTMPLPPYIHERLEEQDRYQTVYAKNFGSAAAPTAGLHFTKDLLKQLEEKGVNITYITLHVGLGTFRPVSVDNIEQHKMHSEFYSMTSATAEILNNCKKNNRKIIAVGTTSTRTLETIINKFGEFKEAQGFTDIFIYPGYEFKAVNSLITNFHLPKSTLMMLVSAFSTKDYIMNAYNEAILNKYRFFSFGDAMLIGDYE